MKAPHPLHMGHVGAHPRRAPKRSRTRAGAPVEAHIHDEIMAEELHIVHSELMRVDSKSSILLGFVAGGLLISATTMTPGAAGWLVKAGMGLAAASIIPLLAVVRPRLGPSGFARHARHTVAQIREELSKVDPRTWRSEQLRLLSQIAVRKYRLLRIAAALQTVALIAVSAGALLVIV